MNWYVAKVIFRSISNEITNQAQFDEQLRLVCADTKCQAFEKALQLGKQHEDRLINNPRQAVKWQFINVAEVNQLTELAHGTELYYHIHEADNADHYIAWANHKAALIELKN